MKRYVSSGAAGTSSVREMISLLLEANVPGIELTAGLKLGPGDLELLGSIARTTPISVHNYFPPPPRPFVLNLASDDAAILAASRDLCLRAIDLSEQFGSDLYTVHAGFCFRADPGDLGSAQRHLPSISREQAEEIFNESIQLLAKYGSSHGVRIAIENNVVTSANAIDDGASRYLLSTPSESRRLLSQWSSLGVGMLLDTAHLQVTAASCGFSPLEYLSSVRQHVVAVHISENDGQRDSNSPLTMQSACLGWIRDFELLEVPLVLETYGLSSAQIREQLHILQSICCDRTLSL